MIEDKTKSFEEIFNEWYKKFLEEEKMMNEEIKTAKIYREEKLAQARREALETIKSYELEQRDKLESDKEKLNVTKSYFDQMDIDFKNQVQKIQSDFKKNKDKVIEYLVSNVMSVEIELPSNVKANTEEANNIEEL